ncbi:UNVERIFIED_CONTAM: hypothetical protein FKN15_019187 [Acipenser sinensis]
MEGFNNNSQSKCAGDFYCEEEFCLADRNLPPPAASSVQVQEVPQSVSINLSPCNTVDGSNARSVWEALPYSGVT